MSPNLRRAFHQALDVILDAWAEEQRAEPRKKTRARALAPAVKALSEFTPEELDAANRAWQRAGYRRTG